MSRADLTVILHTERGVARADYSGISAPVLTGVWTQPLSANGNGSGVGQFEALLKQAPRCARQVWLLSDEVWVNGQSLPAAATAGLNSEALEHALNFEAEPLSGISAADAVLGFANQGQEDGLQNFWVAQLRKETLGEYERAAKAVGVRLAGVLHPAGVPAPVTGVNAEASWARLEVWPQVALARMGGPGVLSRTRMVNAAPGQVRAQVTLSQWLGTTRPAHWEWLGQGEPPALEGQNGARWQRVTLDTDTGLRSWLGAWGAALAVGAPQLPAIRPVAPQRPARHFVLAGLACQAVVMLACYGYFLWAEKERVALNAQLMELGTPAKQLAELDQKIKKGSDELQKLDKENMAESVRQGMADVRTKMERRRYVDLLGRLSEVQPDDVAVRNIETDTSGKVKIVGVALEPRKLDQFAADLAAKLGRMWHVQPPQSSLQSAETTVPVWEFTLVLDYGASNKPAAPAPARNSEHSPKAAAANPKPAAQTQEGSE